MANYISENSVQISQGFKTYTYPENTKMPKGELVGKSIIAVSVGLIPFLVNQLVMGIFKIFSFIGGHLQKAESGATSSSVKYAIHILRGAVGVPGMTSAAGMVLSAKLFSISQKAVWGKYVEKPEGDGPNTRLAWYGAKPIKDLFSDLSSISNGFYDKKPENIFFDVDLLELSKIKI